MEDRLNYIDHIKGFAIILVVLGHTYSNDNIITIWINSFHMPLFFMISGYLIKYKESIYKNQSFKWKHKLKKIMLPYLIFGIFISLFLSILSYLGGQNFYDILSKNFINIVTLEGVQALWFLPCLFIAEYLFYLVNLCGKKGYIIVTILFIITLIMHNKLNQGVNLVFARSFIALGFITIGYLLFMLINKLKISISSIIFMSVICLIFSIINSPSATIYNLKFNNIIFYIITSLSGSLGVILLFKKLDKINFKLLKFYGANSIIILCMHGIIIEIIRLLDYKIVNNCLSKLGLMEGIVFSLIVMSIMIPLINIINNRFYFLIGKTKN